MDWDVHHGQLVLHNYEEIWLANGHPSGSCYEQMVICQTQDQRYDVITLH